VVFEGCDSDLFGKAIRDFRKGVAGVDEIADVESRKQQSKLAPPARAKVD